MKPVVYQRGAAGVTHWAIRITGPLIIHANVTTSDWPLRDTVARAAPPSSACLRAVL